MCFLRKKKNERAGECRKGLLQLSLAREAGENIATKKRKYCFYVPQEKERSICFGVSSCIALHCLLYKLCSFLSVCCVVIGRTLLACMPRWRRGGMIGKAQKFQEFPNSVFVPTRCCQNFCPSQQHNPAEFYIFPSPTAVPRLV